MKIFYSFPTRIGTNSSNPNTSWNQVAGLIQNGVSVSLCAGSCELPIPGLKHLKNTLNIYGIKIPIRIIGMEIATAMHDRITARTLKQIHEKAKIDIVHCWPSGALETLKTAKELGIKSVLERPSAHTRFVYKVTSEECERLGFKFKEPHYTAFNKSILEREEEEFRRADKLLCPSDFVMQTFIDEGFPQEKLCRHRYGYDTKSFTPKKSYKRDDDDKFTMAYIGDCHPLKGLHFALQAWSQSKLSSKGRFYICGRFMPEYRQFLSKFLSYPSVEYLGFRSDVAEIMQKCDAIVLPSLAEGSSLATYEARACGCVLLVSEATGAICKHMENALVHKPGDVNTLREHINLLASDRNLLYRLRQKSLATIDELTWTAAAKKLISAYQECLES